jgi:para-aminobenzoate synthetase component 1
MQKVSAEKKLLFNIESLSKDWTEPRALRHAMGRRYPFLLDGSGGPDRFSRYSFAGCDPFLAIHSKGMSSRLEYLREGRTEEVTVHPLELLRELLARYRTDERGHFPLAPGGAVGYLSYDLFPLIEKVERTAVDDLDMPDMFFCFYDAVVAFDHEAREVFLASRADTPGELKEFWRSLPPAGETAASKEVLDVSLGDLTPNQTPEEFMKAVETAREHIKAGDVYQVNLSQRFCLDYDIDPLEFYLRFRTLSPAPFGACLFPDNFAVLSNSPERYLLIDKDYIETRPIKGTRPRGRSREEDERLSGELKASVKDNAEHLMIVDLERNDLGRVCNYNSVHVPELAVVESYANVHHLVSTVAGTVHPSRDVVDSIRNSFPGGSITGAPKVWALRIIDKLEPTARGVYCGSIGYIDFSGRVDLNIAIRTAVKTGKRLCFQVGGGIVYDSDPKDEYEETITKAQSFLKALSGRGRVWEQS